MHFSARIAFKRLFKYRCMTLTNRRMTSNVRIGCASGFWGDTAMSGYYHMYLT